MDSWSTSQLKKMQLGGNKVREEKRREEKKREREKWSVSCGRMNDDWHCDCDDESPPTLPLTRRPFSVSFRCLFSPQSLIEFFASHGIPKTMDIKQKYNTKAAEVYREMLSAKAEGRAYTMPKLSKEEMASPAGGGGAKKVGDGHWRGWWRC